MAQDELNREIVALQQKVDHLQSERQIRESKRDWPPREFYGVYYALSGSVLGLFGAAASLLLNIIGALAMDLPPLKLIQVYLTFPMGEAAHEIHDSGLALAIGVCLYLLTGMALGVPFALILNRFFGASGFAVRFAASTVLALLLWVVNFYGILSWLQPMLFGGDWIVREIPPAVAAGTHLVFGWTLCVLQPFSRFIAYHPPEAA